MTMTIGRVGLDGVTLRSPNAAVGSVRQDGDRLTIRGTLADPSGSLGLTSTKARAQRAQILGLVGNIDEDVIPVTDTENPHIDGYYAVIGTSVDDPEDPARQVYFPYTVDLLRLPGWQAPLFEVQCSGALRSNVHSITTSTALGWVGYPASASAVRFVRASAATAVTEYGASGNNVIGLYATGSNLYTETLLYSVAASDFYDCACEIRTGSRVASSSAPDVTDHRVVVGRQVPNLPTAWMISNDLVRVLPGPNNGEILIGQWQDSAHTPAGADSWTYKAYKVIKDGSGGTTTGDGDTITVLRNSPECVSVRIWFDHGSQVASYTDFTVRRGSPVVEGCSVIIGTNATLAHGFGRFSTEATSSATGGIIATSDDANSNKFRIRSPQTVTANNTNGFIYLSSAAQRFAFGVDTDFFSGLDVTDAYFAAMTHRQSVSVR